MKNKRPSYTTKPMQVPVGRPQYELPPMQFDVSRPHVTTDPLQFLIDAPVGGGVPAPPPRSAPIGAVDAQPGTKLYEMAQRHGRQHAPQKPSQEDIISSLISKATTGMATPGEGMVPFGELPGALRHLASQAWGQPVVGFDPTKLTPHELAELERLREMGRQEVQKRVDAQPPRPMPPTAALLGRGGRS